MKSAWRAQARRSIRWSESGLRQLLGCLLALVIAVGAAAPALAAPAQAAPAQAIAGPATEAEMGLYQQFAAVNLCLARADGLTMEQAVPLAAGTLAVLLGERHGGRIEALEGRQLGHQELLSGSANYVLLAAAQLCPTRIPDELLGRLKEELGGFAKDVQNSRPT